MPIHEYTHGIGISITGGFVYRGSLLSGMKDKYIFGDWSANWGGTSGHIYSLEEDPEGMKKQAMEDAEIVKGDTSEMFAQGGIASLLK